MASARGESQSDKRFSCAALSTKIAQEVTTKPPTNLCDKMPAGRARVAVRGFAASICESARRLNAIAADRAEIMHSTIQPSCAAVGIPPAASIAPQSANGSAKMECSHLIISSVARTSAKKGTQDIVEQGRADLSAEFQHISLRAPVRSCEETDQGRSGASASAGLPTKVRESEFSPVPVWL